MRQWQIEGRDGANPPFWRAEFPFHRYTENQMIELLRLLVAKEELSIAEICASTGRKRSGRAALLEVHRSFRPYSLSCGSGRYFIARVTDEIAPAK